MKCSGNEVAVVLHSFTAQETKFAVMTFMIGMIGEFVFFFSVGYFCSYCRGSFLRLEKKSWSPAGLCHVILIDKNEKGFPDLEVLIFTLKW